MRSLPDNAFEIAVCDPPYGKGNDESLVGKGGGSDRDSRNISRPPGGAEITEQPTSRRFGGWFRRYDKPMEQTAGRTQGKILQASGHIGSAEGRGQRGTKSGGQSRSSTMGRRPSAGVLRRAFPYQPQSDNLGRQLLFPASDKMFSRVAKDEHLRTFFNGDGRIRLDVIHGER